VGWGSFLCVETVLTFANLRNTCNCVFLILGTNTLFVNKSPRLYTHVFVLNELVFVAMTYDFLRHPR